MDINADGRVCKQTLTLTGSTAALIAAMHAFNDVEGIRSTSGNDASPAPTPSTNTGAGTLAPVPLPSAPGGAVLTPIAPMPNTSNDSTDSDDDDGTPAGDGAGVDSAGLPWDERIHSSSRKMGKDGTWNKRRGGPSGDELAAIEAELRGAGAPTPPVPMPVPLAPVPAAPPMPLAAPEPLAPPAAMQPPPLPVPAPIAAPAPVPMPAPVVEQPVAAPAPLPAPMPVAAAATAPTEWDFASFMQAVGPKMGEGAGMIDPAYLTVVCAHYGLNSITDLAPKPELIPTIVAQFTADGRW